MGFLKDRTLIALIGVSLIIIVLMAPGLYLSSKNMSGVPEKPVTISTIGQAIMPNNRTISPAASTVAALDAGHYVGLQDNEQLTWSQVSGPFIPLPDPVPPGPPINYNISTSSSGNFPYTINDSTKILLGVLNNTRGTSVSDIDNLPYTLGPGLTVTGVYNNGNVEMVYKGQYITLRPGDSWSSPSVSWNETFYIYSPPLQPNETAVNTYMNNNTTQIPCMVQYTGNWVVENKGLFTK